MKRIHGLFAIPRCRMAGFAGAAAVLLALGLVFAGCASAPAEPVEIDLAGTSWAEEGSSASRALYFFSDTQVFKMTKAWIEEKVKTMMGEGGISRQKALDSLLESSAYTSSYTRDGNTITVTPGVVNGTPLGESQKYTIKDAQTIIQPGSGPVAFIGQVTYKLQQ